mmetsp:Transcript_19513/g.60611  ORF Transcript_19513/g.60611 Transcript_19513/m.60611 type:complete len:113 (-) Transcript_19513:7-345(-)
MPTPIRVSARCAREHARAAAVHHHLHLFGHRMEVEVLPQLSFATGWGVGIRQLQIVSCELLRVKRGSENAVGYKCGGWVVERVCVGCARRVMVAEEKTWDTAAEGVKVHLPS